MSWGLIKHHPSVSELASTQSGEAWNIWESWCISKHLTRSFSFLFLSSVKAFPFSRRGETFSVTSALTGSTRYEFRQLPPQQILCLLDHRRLSIDVRGHLLGQPGIYQGLLQQDFLLIPNGVTYSCGLDPENHRSAPSSYLFSFVSMMMKTWLFAPLLSVQNQLNSLEPHSGCLCLCKGSQAFLNSFVMVKSCLQSCQEVRLCISRQVMTSLTCYVSGRQ